MKELMIKLITETCQIPEMINKISCSRWELEKELAKKLAKENEDPEIRKIEENLQYADQELEFLRCRQTSAVATINLVAALTIAGKTEDIQSVVSAFERMEKNQKESQTNQEKKAEKTGSDNKKNKNSENKKSQDKSLESGEFTIKKVEPGKNEETVWATAVASDGSIVKICAQNGNRESMLEAVGKKAFIRYRAMSESRLYCTKVEIQK